jgi:hypothetical protein
MEEDLRIRSDEIPAHALSPRRFEERRFEEGATRAQQVAKAGAAATAALTAVALPAMALGLMRLNFGKMLGTAVAPDSRRTRALGWGLHTLNGLLLAGAYQAVFRMMGSQPTAARGALLGVAHAGVALAGLSLLPRVHPRPFTAGLRPLSATAYGPLTLPGMLAGHIVYGAVAGAALGADRHPPSAAE